MRMENSKTDIVILTYNSSKFIELCIERIRRHTKNYQLFVIDNGSTDETKIILERLREPDDVIVYNEKNRGCGPARNQGAALGTSPLLCFVDSDLLVGPGWLEGMKVIYDAEDTGIVGVVS